MINGHDEYYQRYVELQFFMKRAYVDIYSLEEIENYNKMILNKNRAMAECSLDVLVHICELLKSDLGLIVWKMYSDENVKANTIKHLSNYIKKNYSGDTNLVLPKMRLSSELREIESRIGTLRKTFFAHNDLIKAGGSVHFTEMKSIVEELRNKLNGLCFEKLDSRVLKTDDKQLMSIKYSVSLGFGMMIQNNVYPITEE